MIEMENKRGLQMDILKSAVNDFINLEHGNISSDHFFHKVISEMHNLISAIGISLESGFSKDQIIAELKIPREIHARSPFVNRLQNWPRGYQGDFETIEYICECENTAPKNTIEYYIEWYALNSAVAQQHRNKINIQSSYILNSIAINDESGILVIGCGSGRDIRNIQNVINNKKIKLYLNDIDQGALDFTKSKIDDKLLDKVIYINGNVLKILRNPEYKYKKFNLILFGGVFDYLQDKAIILLLNHMYATMLDENGKIIFTNINQNNPFRYWMEYLASWKLIERSQEDCISICKKASIPENNVRIYFEETKLALIIEISKKNERS